MKKQLESFKKKDGWVTMVVMIAVTAMLPILLFFLVDLNYYYQMKEEAQHIADNMASSAVRTVDTEKLSSGTIEILEEEANEIAKELFKIEYGLTDELLIQEPSRLREDPLLKIYVIHPVTEEEFETDEGYTFHVNKPTVIVYTSIKPKGIFFSKLIELQTFSVYEIEAPPSPSSIHQLQFQKVYFEEVSKGEIK